MLPHREFHEEVRALESTYLESDDPIEQSGFSGGRARWIAERSPLVDAIDRDGDFLDVGCANGLLAADVVGWSDDRGIAIVPHGVDLGPGLIAVARERLARFEENFHVADAWTWEPERRWTYVYSLLDLSPQELWCEWLGRLMGWVEPDGKLIIGSYGDRTPPRDPEDVAGTFARCGLSVDGVSNGGDPLVTRFAWSGGVSPG